MPEWLKVLLTLATLGGWGLTVFQAARRGELPDATTLGIPTALLVAYASTSKIGRRRGGTDDAGDEPESDDGLELDAAGDR